MSTFLPEAKTFLLQGEPFLPQAKISLPQTGFVRLPQIIGDRKRGIPGIFPVSRSTWFAGVKSGKYPQPVKLSERCVGWRAGDINALLNQHGGEVS